VGTLSMREMLPSRRPSWTQHVRIGGQSVYMTVGEYPDGRPGEIFLDMAKTGTLLRGVMDSLARMVSIALQCGAGIEVIIHALRGLVYPPDGLVEGSDYVQECSSVTDWIASELEARYMHEQLSERYMRPTDILHDSEERSDERPPEKVAGYLPEPWRTGI
jgi:ribonucleoside-diphosphate reductase alpha chain